MPEVLLWHWFAFAALVVVLLALDLLVFHRVDHAPSLGESTWWTVFWIGLALIFNGGIWWWGFRETGTHEAGILFLTGYVIEKSLSMDNIFVFVVIFRYFQIPMMYQYRVLFWGILGAVVFRLVFILAGIELIERFAIITPIFGGILVYSAYKLAMHSGGEVHPENNFMLKISRRFFHVAQGDHHQYGHRFFVRERGLFCITPMFLVLLVVESTDVLFAVDSVPAIIGITRDPFIAFTSNIFAILGLRALYFLLAGVIEMFRYLHYGLSAVLAFVGLKMIGEHLVEHEKGAHLIPVWVSLLVIALLVGVSIAASLLAQRREKATGEKPGEPGAEPADSRSDDSGNAT